MSHQQLDDLPPFKYDCLRPGEIRLLIPTDDENGLSWVMQTVNLDDKIEFDALSYVWGSQHRSYPISCNGGRHLAHQNLYRALPFLARRHTFKQPWVQVNRDDLTKEGDEEQKTESGGEKDPKNKEIDSTRGHVETSRIPSIPERDILNSKRTVTQPELTRDNHGTWIESSQPGNRGQQSPRRIWIDALSINQADEDEKITQIALMSKIYRQADMVWAWFNIDMPNDEGLFGKVVDLLPVLADADNHARQAQAQIEHGADHVKHEAHSRLSANLSRETWDLLLQVLDNEWYYRVWIVQEFALARQITFLCHNHVVGASMLYSIFQNPSCWSDTYRRWPELFHRLHRAWIHRCDLYMVRAGSEFERSLSGNPISSESLARLAMIVADFMFTGQQYCWLPQDRIFGILGLFDSEVSKAMGLDLYATKTTPELYTQYTAAMISLISSFEICREERYPWKLLYFATQQKVHQLPSWVPDFHQHFDIGVGLSTISGFYHASGKPCVARKGDQLGKLVLRGRVVQTVASVCSPMPTTFFRPLELTELFTLFWWEEEMRATFVSKQKGGHVQMKEFECYWRTLIGNLTEDEQGSITCQTYEAFHNSIENFFCKWERVYTPFICSSPNDYTDCYLQVDAKWPLVDDNVATEAGRFCARMENEKHRILFYTTEGSIGFTRQTLSVGDRICVFDGAPTPHVIRRALSHEEEAYELVCEAYLHGFMDGEVDAMNFEDQDILLV